VGGFKQMRASPTLRTRSGGVTTRVTPPVTVLLGQRRTRIQWGSDRRSRTDKLNDSSRVTGRNPDVPRTVDGDSQRPGGETQRPPARRALRITFDLLVESLGGDAVDRGQLAIEDDARGAQDQGITLKCAAPTARVRVPCTVTRAC
jgi:hypothetical protein